MQAVCRSIFAFSFAVVSTFAAASPDTPSPHILPQAQPGAPYSAQLSIPPGLGYPYASCKLTGDPLPKGLIFDCARLQLRGRISSGIERNYSVNLKLVDADGNAKNFELSLRVSSQPTLVSLADQPEQAQNPTTQKDERGRLNVPASFQLGEPNSPNLPPTEVMSDQSNSQLTTKVPNNNETDGREAALLSSAVAKLQPAALTVRSRRSNYHISSDSSVYSSTLVQPLRGLSLTKKPAGAPAGLAVAHPSQVAQLPSAIVGKKYTSILAVTTPSGVIFNGTAANALAPGSTLPAGLSFSTDINGDPIIQGIPTTVTSKADTFTLSFMDDGVVKKSGDFSITVVNYLPPDPANPNNLDNTGATGTVAAPIKLPQAVIGNGYRAQLEISSSSPCDKYDMPPADQVALSASGLTLTQDQPPYLDSNQIATPAKTINFALNCHVNSAAVTAYYALAIDTDTAQAVGYVPSKNQMQDTNVPDIKDTNYFGIAGTTMSAASGTNIQAKLFAQVYADTPSPVPHAWVWGSAKIGSISQSTSAITQTAVNSAVTTALSSQNQTLVQSGELAGGLEFHFTKWNKDKANLSAILSGGAITPLTTAEIQQQQQNFVVTPQVQTFYTSGIYSNRTNAQAFENACPSSIVKADMSTNLTCYVAFYPEDRARFFRHYEGGIRFKVPLETFDSDLKFPLTADVTIGQNEVVTGGGFNGLVLHLAAVSGIPCVKHVYVFGGMDLGLNGSGDQAGPLLFGPSSSDTAPSTANTVIIQVPQPNRDRYMLGVGFNLPSLFNKSSAATTSSSSRSNSASNNGSCSGSSSGSSPS